MNNRRFVALRAVMPLSDPGPRGATVATVLRFTGEGSGRVQVEGFVEERLWRGQLLPPA
jgi:hypothetical protein